MAGRVKDKVTGLTAQQERFAQEVVANISLSAAYRAAYNCKPGIKPETVHNRAFVLSKKGEVEARIKTLQAATVIKEQWTRERLIQFIRDGLLEIATTPGDKRDKVAALKLLGEMQIADAFAAKKTDATVRKIEPAKAAKELQAAIERALTLPAPKGKEPTHPGNVLQVQ